MLLLGLKDLELTCKGIEIRLDIEFQSLDEQSKNYSKYAKEYEELIKMLNDVEKELESSPSNENSDKLQQFNDLKLKLALSKNCLMTLKDYKTTINSSIFVRLMMGQVSIKMWKSSDQLQFKNEYNKFKNRTTYIFILFPCKQSNIATQYNKN